MNAGWQVLDLSGFSGKLGYRRGRVLVVSEQGEQSYVSLASLAVILIGTKMSISGALLGKLKDYDIAILVCDWRNEPIAAAYPWCGHSRIAARHNAQSALSVPRQKQAWAQIIRAKISGQSVNLHSVNTRAAARLLALVKEVKSGDPSNCEAQAARIYWGALTEDSDFRRLPGQGISGLNCCLDYAYTILRSHGIRAVSSAGLSGPIGLFHRGRANSFALVDDIIEPFRPAIDAAVMRLQLYDTDDPNVKKQLVNASNQIFDRSGHTIATVLEDFAQQLGKYVEGDIETLKVPVWKGAVNGEA